MRISDWSSDVCSSDLNVMCSMTAANRDPEAFDDPDTLRFDRKPANSGGLRNMTFGTGRHRCLGANLAQANLPIMLGRTRPAQESEDRPRGRAATSYF